MNFQEIRLYQMKKNAESKLFDLIKLKSRPFSSICTGKLWTVHLHILPVLWSIAVILKLVIGHGRADNVLPPCSIKYIELFLENEMAARFVIIVVPGGCALTGEKLENQQKDDQFKMRHVSTEHTPILNV